MSMADNIASPELPANPLGFSPKGRGGGKGRGAGWPRTLRLVLVATAIAFVATGAFASWWIVSLGPVSLGGGVEYSPLVVDRDGRLLRPYITPEGRWRFPATRESVDPR